MEFAAWIIAVLGVISAALGVVNILELSSEPIFSDKLTWPFWMTLATVLLLLSIFFMLGRRQSSD